MYEHDVGIDVDTPSPARTGFTGDWNADPGVAGSGNNNVYMRVPDSSTLNYPGSNLSDPGFLELGRAGGSGSVNIGVARDFNYSFTPTQATSDLFYTFSIRNNGGSVTRLRLLDGNSGENRNLTLTLDSTGNLEVNIAGVSADNISGTAAAAGSTNFFVMQVKDDNTAPNPSYYDTYNFWVNPNINPGGITVTDILGTPDHTGVGILRNLNGAGAIAYSSLEIVNLNSDTISSRSQFDEFMITDDIRDIVIPEPGTLVLVGIALGSLLLFRRRR